MRHGDVSDTKVEFEMQQIVYVVDDSKSCGLGSPGWVRAICRTACAFPRSSVEPHRGSRRHTYYTILWLHTTRVLQKDQPVPSKESASPRRR